MNNKIFALIGPHSAGKSTLLTKLMDMGIAYIPTYTTRNPTPQDMNSRTINFISKSGFFKDEWIVKVTYKGEYYGILKRDMLNALKDHKISVCMLDINGVKQVKKFLNQNLETIFLMVDYVTLVDRMLRKGHNNTDMKYHLEYAENNGEFDNWKISNHVVKNTGSVEKGLAQILAIMGLSVTAPRSVIDKL
ncbi:MAG: GTPase [Selenomonadaceae bacterium]|nr:GTPase [Selenomonadaceae bacterium]